MGPLRRFIEWITLAPSEDDSPDESDEEDSEPELERYRTDDYTYTHHFTVKRATVTYAGGRTETIDYVNRESDENSITFEDINDDDWEMKRGWSSNSKSHLTYDASGRTVISLANVEKIEDDNDWTDKLVAVVEVESRLKECRVSEDRDWYTQSVSALNGEPPDVTIWYEDVWEAHESED